MSRPKTLLAFRHGEGARQIAFVRRWRSAMACWLPAGERAAANNAYAVEAADISEAGSCKFESWMSFATNTDFSAVANPSCVVDPSSSSRSN